MQNGTEKYIETVAYLGKLYDFANEKLFNGELKKSVITIQRDERNKKTVGGRLARCGKRTPKTRANTN